MIVNNNNKAKNNYRELETNKESVLLKGTDLKLCVQERKIQENVKVPNQ